MQGPRADREEPTVQVRAWRAMLEGYRDLFRFLEKEFVRGAGVEVHYYDVMLHVSEAAGGRRMTDLADAVVLSKSGLTSLVDRMERDGLLERRPDPMDRRATRIVLTEAGMERFEAVSRHHRGVVGRIFTSQLSEEEATVIVDVMERLRRAVGRGDVVDP
jgi:DNA-binding MarR family transcriptional regulator